MALKSAGGVGVFPAPQPTVRLNGSMADLRRVEDAPQAASGVYNSHDGGLPFKDTLALFSVSWFPTAGLFLISLYVYGYIHATGQPGWEFVCFCFVFLFKS